ncbi:unnamed protein product, partial [Prorocentrum cordatum]
GRWGHIRPGLDAAPAWRGWTAEAGTDLGLDRTSSETSETWRSDGWRAVGGAAGDCDRRDRGDEKYIPKWDGKSVPLRTYERQMRLKRDAEAKTENIHPEALAVPDGAQVLLRYLHTKYDQQETRKVGTLVDEFAEKPARNVGELALDFETRYETKIRELEEAMDEPLNKHLMAQYFLKKLRVEGDEESQIITGAGNELVYEKLPDSAKARRPRASTPRKTSTLQPSAGGGGGAHREHLNRNRRRRGRGGGRAAHAARGGQKDDPDKAADDDGEWPEDAERDEEMDSEGDLGAEKAAEHEHVLEELLAFLTDITATVTHAKKARAEAEKTREFYRGGTKGGSAANAER